MKRIISLISLVAMLTLVLSSCFLIPLTIERGETTDTAYTNESLGITFTKPLNWTFYTDEQIAELMDISADMYKDKDLIKSADITSVIDFMAVKNGNTNNVNLSIENLAVTGNKKITEEEYLEITKKNINEQVAGMSYTFSESKTVKLGEEEYLMIEASCNYSGIQLTQFIYVRKVDKFMVCVTATTNGSMEASDFEAMFS